MYLIWHFRGKNGDIQKQLNQTNQKLISVDTFNGVSKIEWDPDAEVTPNGQMVFFIESPIFDIWSEIEYSNIFLFQC